MDIRKYIIILCLLCCPALSEMAYGQIEYKPISEEADTMLFSRTPNIEVTGVSYGLYERRGKVLFASMFFRFKTSFAIKVKFDTPGIFSFDIQENFWNVPSFRNTVIVDGKTDVLPVTMTSSKSYQSMKFELSAGEHEIVIKSNLSSVQYFGQPSNLQIKNMVLHSHRVEKIVDERPAICGQDGYIKKTCDWCLYSETETFPMPAAEHKYDSELFWQNSCVIPASAYRECLNCGLSEYKIRGHKSHLHDFQNGQCAKEGCRIKMPVKNAAGVYQVGDAYELRGLAEHIAVGYIPRDCNIDLTADIVYPADLAHLPIGTTDYPFAGTFDGHGHSVGNMHTPVLTDIIGLFGVVEGSPRRFAVIANVVIDSTSTLKAIGKVGGVAGWADHCDIVRCVNRATIQGDVNVGGIVGYSLHDCHLIDCAGLGIINCKENGGLLSGTLRQGYIMDSYGSGSFATKGIEPVLAPTTDSPLRHCFQLDAKDPMTGVTTFSSAQLSDGTLARMLCEKNGKDMPTRWQQGTKEGCPMPIFMALTDRPASAIQPQETRAAMDASYENLYSMEEEPDHSGKDEDDEWYSVSQESELMEDSLAENFVFYSEADSTLSDFACYVSTTYRNAPAVPMFTAMKGGDITEFDVTYAKKDTTVVLEYNYMMDGRRQILTEAKKQYMTPDSVIHVEVYDVVRNEEESEFLMTSNTMYFPDYSGYEENVSYGVATKLMDWEVSLDEDLDPTLYYYFYDEAGQERVDFDSIPLTEKDHDDVIDPDNDDYKDPFDMDYTLDEKGNLKDLHYLSTDPLTGKKYNIGGQYYIYDEKGELLQAVSYEPVEPHSSEMRQTEYTTFQNYNAEEAPTAIIPIEQLQPGTLDGTPARTSTHIYDMHGNLIRLSNDAAALKSLPKGIYITRGKKIMVR